MCSLIILSFCVCDHFAQVPNRPLQSNKGQLKISRLFNGIRQTLHQNILIKWGLLSITFFIMEVNNVSLIKQICFAFLSSFFIRFLISCQLLVVAISKRFKVLSAICHFGFVSNGFRQEMIQNCKASQHISICNYLKLFATISWSQFLSTEAFPCTSES